MAVTAVMFYDVVLWAHIMGIILAFGPTYSYGLFFAMAGQDPRAMPAVAKATITWNRYGTTGGVILAILTGLYLADDRWDFSDFFISWGLVAVIILLGLVHGFFIPKTQRLAEVAEADIAASGTGEIKLSEEAGRIGAQLGRVGPLAGVLVLLTVYVMTAKPFL
jgi:hypothetical protein